MVAIEIKQHEHAKEIKKCKAQNSKTKTQSKTNLKQIQTLNPERRCGKILNQLQLAGAMVPSYGITHTRRTFRKARTEKSIPPQPGLDQNPLTKATKDLQNQ